jgi:RNA polymerase sigma factor for flagellar operon FliA
MATPGLMTNRRTVLCSPSARSAERHRRPALGAARKLALAGRSTGDPPREPAVTCEQERRVLELLPLVRRMALKMRRNLPAHVDVDDLVSEGVLGLLDAARKYDAGKQVKIESYARHRIRGAILDGLRTLDTASRDLRKKNRKLEESVRTLEATLGRPAEDEEMARALGLSLEELHRSVSELQGIGMDWLHPMQTLPPRQISEKNLVAENQESQFDLCYRRERREIANQALAGLSERERRIIVLYHGREMTMKQIGAELGIDESRVSQLHSGAVGRLRLIVNAIVEKASSAPVPPTSDGTRSQGDLQFSC